MADEQSRFQGDWNANKGYLQLMINYIALSGEYSITEDIWHEYRVVRQLYRITKKVIDPKVTESVGKILKEIRLQLRPTHIDTRTQEGRQALSNLQESAEERLEQVEMDIISNIHDNNLILPKKQNTKSLNKLWEEYGLEDDNNPEEASEDNKTILQEEPK
jgi:hypothetical protein